MAKRLRAGVKARLTGEIHSRLEGVVLASTETFHAGQVMLVGVHRLAITHQLTREEFLRRVRRNEADPTAAKYTGSVIASQLDIEGARQSQAPEDTPGMHYYAADELGSATHAPGTLYKLPEERQLKRKRGK